MNIYTKVTRTGTIDDVITLADVKRAIGVLDNYEDDEIQSQIYTAFELAERYCYRCFTPCDVVAERTDNAMSFFLPYGENVVFTSVEVDGEAHTDYDYSEVSGRFTLKNVTRYEKLTITYSCGFTSLPASIDRGIKFMVSNIRNSGQDFVAGMTVSDLPLRAIHLLDAEKHHVI
ncbi:hypothetical protein [Vibrio phage Artemius]|nr:hypothetical protein [Vibrio phage Artemius]